MTVRDGAAAAEVGLVRPEHDAVGRRQQNRWGAGREDPGASLARLTCWRAGRPAGKPVPTARS